MLRVLEWHRSRTSGRNCMRRMSSCGSNRSRFRFTVDPQPHGTQPGRGQRPMPLLRICSLSSAVLETHCLYLRELPQPGHALRRSAVTSKSGIWAVTSETGSVRVFKSPTARLAFVGQCNKKALRPTAGGLNKARWLLIYCAPRSAPFQLPSGPKSKRFSLANKGESYYSVKAWP